MVLLVEIVGGYILLVIAATWFWSRLQRLTHANEERAAQAFAEHQAELELRARDELAERKRKRALLDAILDD